MMLPTRLIRPLGNALREQILVGVGRRGPQHVGEDVGDEPVQLLGHRPVAAPQARLEMDDGDSELASDHRAGRGRVDVADDDDPVGPVGERHLLIGDHHPAGLLGMAARADSEMVVGLRQLQVGEEGVRHVHVVMLAGMDQHRLEARRRGERVPERRHLHEIRARGGDQMDALGHGGGGSGQVKIGLGDTSPQRRLGPQRVKGAGASHPAGSQPSLG
jgi:hypothetical protein